MQVCLYLWQWFLYKRRTRRLASYLSSTNPIIRRWSGRQLWQIQSNFIVISSSWSNSDTSNTWSSTFPYVESEATEDSVDFSSMTRLSSSRYISQTAAYFIRDLVDDTCCISTKFVKIEFTYIVLNSEVLIIIENVMETETITENCFGFIRVQIPNLRPSEEHAREK